MNEQYEVVRSAEVTIIDRKTDGLFVDFVIQLDGRETTNRFTNANLCERLFEVRNEDFSENFFGNFESEAEDGTIHSSIAYLHIYEQENDRGLLEILELRQQG